MRTAWLGAAAALAGLVAGLCSVALHGRGWGLALAVAASVTTALAFAPGWERLAYCLAYAAMTGYLSIPRPEGDYAIASDWAGYSMLTLAVTLLVIGVGTFRRVRPTAEGDQT